jgi:hypothetical protein
MKLGVVVQLCNPSTQEAEARGSVVDQLGLPSKKKQTNLNNRAKRVLKLMKIKC